MEGILALMIPVLAMATGCIAVARMPREKLGGGGRQQFAPAPETAALADEVAVLREELARVNERLDFTERLLMDTPPAPRLAAPVPSERVPATAGV